MRKNMILKLSLIWLVLHFGCKSTTSEIKPAENGIVEERLVLAQWSFNRELFKGDMNTFDFVRVAKQMGFVGVEYVNQFFIEKAEDIEFLDSLRNTADELGIRNTLLMIDRAGNLGASNEEERRLAVAQHKKWILAAERLGCPNVRVNAHGDGSSEEIFAACKKSIKELLIWGKERNVGVLVENHGSYSSDGDWLLRLIEELGPYGGSSLADFDNWCIERENGELWGAPCTKEYDRYLGMTQLLPSAKSVSVKAFDFDEGGMPVRTDFAKMFDLINKSGYKGYLAVEFEGDTIDAKVGILKTIALIKKLHKAG